MGFHIWRPLPTSNVHYSAIFQSTMLECFYTTLYLKCRAWLFYSEEWISLPEVAWILHCELFARKRGLSLSFSLSQLFLPSFLLLLPLPRVIGCENPPLAAGKDNATLEWNIWWTLYIIDPRLREISPRNKEGFPRSLPLSSLISFLPSWFKISLKTSTYLCPSFSLVQSSQRLRPCGLEFRQDFCFQSSFGTSALSFPFGHRVAIQ